MIVRAVLDALQGAGGTRPLILDCDSQTVRPGDKVRVGGGVWAGAVATVTGAGDRDGFTGLAQPATLLPVCTGCGDTSDTPVCQACQTENTYEGNDNDTT